MLSRNDIEIAMANGHLQIYPFEKRNLTGIGYNLSTTNFAFSVNRGVLLTIHKRTTPNGIEHYVVIPGNDTILFFTKEYVAADKMLAGTFHSKVARVCQGLGHVSTTLDPTWKGQLIISVNNPTSKEKIFELDHNSGNVVTMLLHRLDTPVTGLDIHDNNRGRCDLLLEHFSIPFSGKKYKQKHYQLKDFVLSEFADSLNGFDDFLGDEQPEDIYSQRINRLRSIQSRLKTDQILHKENRYLLGSGGKYSIFRNDEEKETIRNCSLYCLVHRVIANEGKNMCDINGETIDRTLLDLDHTFSDMSPATTDATKAFALYLRIIDNELEMINHNRRIAWQNSKFEQFAGEDSELVRLCKRELRKKMAYKVAIPFLLFLALATFGMVLLLGSSIAPSHKTIIATLSAPVFTLVLQFFYVFYKKLKNT